MKRFIPALLLLLFAPSSEAVAIRVEGDLKALHEAGFDFSYSPHHSSKEVFSLTIGAPRKFKFDSGGDVFVKPFTGVSIVQTAGKVEEDSRLLGAPSSQFRLETHQGKDGRHSCWCSVIVANASTSYIVVSFAHEPKDGSNDWPMVVYIPVAKLIEQLRAEQGGADQSATGVESKAK